MKQEMLSDLLLAGLNATENSHQFAQLSTEHWEELIDFVTKQRVAPLFYKRLKTSQLVDVVPTPVLRRWQKLFYTNDVRNQEIYQELGIILTALQACPIPVIVLKGAHLAQAVYSHRALRFMIDIDLMVSQADVPVVVKKLLEFGYQPLEQLTPETYFSTHHLPRFIKPAAAAGIEVHWTITPPQQGYSIQMDELWARAIPVTIAGVEVLGLCPADLLLHLCCHTTYHHGFAQGIRSLCDIDATIRRYQAVLDWTQVQQRTEAWDWGRGVHLALYLAYELLATPVPAAVLQALEPPGFTAQIADAAATQMFAKQAPEKMGSDVFAKTWSVTSLTEKSIMLLKRFFLAPEIMATVYPVRPHSFKLYLYYPVRFKDLLVRYTNKTWRLLRGDSELTTLTRTQHTLVEWLKRG